MRHAAVALATLLVLATSARGADDEDDLAAEEQRARDALPSVAGGVPLVDVATARWTYQVIAAPRVPVQIGAIAAAGLDAVAGRGRSVPDVLGPTTTEPTAWPYDVDVPVRGTGLLRPQPATEDERIAALYAVTSFDLGADASGLRMLEIRVRYRDAVRVWLNGLEVARRSVDPSTTASAFAARPHGPEWETFYVPAAPGLLRLGANTLALETRPTGSRLAPELAVDVLARRDLGIVRGPVLGEVTTTTAEIRVETDGSVAAELAWGIGDGPLEHRIASGPAHMHAFALAGLPAASRISYQVTAGGSRSARFAFKTMPAAGSLVRIGVYGDVRGGHDVHRRIVDAMLAEPLDVVAVTGDMVLRGSDEADWQRFFAVTHELLAQVRYVPAIGNHDVGLPHDDTSAFSLPAGPPGRPDRTYWYSLRIGDVHLVFLDSNAYEQAEQETWLEADLAAARADHVRAIIALTHDGPFSRGTHRGNDTARDRYVPILAKHQVDLLVAGHDHLYQRGEHAGLRYIVSGGGGAQLYRPSCGVRKKPKCPEDGMKKLASEHHFLVVTVDRTTLEVCPRKSDGRLLEPCQRFPLGRP